MRHCFCARFSGQRVEQQSFYKSDISPKFSMWRSLPTANRCNRPLVTPCTRITQLCTVRTDYLVLCVFYHQQARAVVAVTFLHTAIQRGKTESILVGAVTHRPWTADYTIRKLASQLTNRATHITRTKRHSTYFGM
jgi:hypothetical protein